LEEHLPNVFAGVTAIETAHELIATPIHPLMDTIDRIEQHVPDFATMGLPGNTDTRPETRFEAR
jgi:hypothetical protein